MTVPAWTAGWAAAVVLVVALFVLGTRWATPPLASRRSRSLRRVPPYAEPLCATIGVIAFLVAVFLGLTSEFLADRAALHAWAALSLLSVLVGDVFRPFNPWRAIARRAPTQRRRHRQRLGRSPAVAGLFAFGLTQVAVPAAWQSETTAIFLLAYAGFQVAAARRFGESAWAEHGDGLGLTLSTFACLAPLTISGGWLMARRPLSDLESRRWRSGSTALLAVTIAIAGYDTAGHENDWSRLLSDAQSALPFAPDLAHIVVNAAALALFALATALVCEVGLSGMQRVAPARSAARLKIVLGSALVPIALAYLIAHQVVTLAGSEHGHWYAQFLVLTVGHLIALVVAYDRGIATLPNLTVALRTTYWALGVLAASLSFDLWLTWQART